MTLCLGAEFTYVDNTSNKYYIAVLAGNSVHVRYGRRGVHHYSHGSKNFEDHLSACAEMWKILRGKTGKGYHVIDAAVFPVSDFSVAWAREGRQRFSEAGYGIIEAWNRFEDEHRSSDRRDILSRPALTGKTPRTPRQGKSILAKLVDPDCPESILIESALAGPSEQFLGSMAMSHPNCSANARVANFLSQRMILASA